MTRSVVRKIAQKERAKQKWIIYLVATAFLFLFRQTKEAGGTGIYCSSAYVSARAQSEALP